MLIFKIEVVEECGYDSPQYSNPRIFVASSAGAALDAYTLGEALDTDYRVSFIGEAESV